ncbi:MAG: N-acetyl-gamma-glutamyl-phosphate reductase [Synergistaceae bacterium]|nr:N-acetyl-gamma-glutamyl-phosphate reductase [Synergistaceae bacterium]
MCRAVVWGANGMAGGEVLRILAAHPSIEVKGAVSRSRSGQPIWHTHPHLRRSLPELAFCTPEEGKEAGADIVFLALPHGVSAPLIREYIDRGVKVADLSGDVRLRNPQDYKKWYGAEPLFPELLDKAVYGLPELYREKLRGAGLASGVGCNASCAILGLYPLARSGLIGDIRIEVRVGSSEAGATPTTGSHHPFRSRALRVYEPFRHRHLAEILQELNLSEDRVTMTMTAVEMIRGVQMVAYVNLSRKVKEGEIWKAYRSSYENEPFVSLCLARPSHLRLPEPKLVTGSNQALTGFALHEDGRRLVVVTAIDNLMKGAAGSAVQSANLLLGLDETAGLEMLPVYPA